MTNTFWLAANILFDLGTGKRTDVLTLVNQEIDASVFQKSVAEGFLNFVATRSPEIRWAVEPTNLRGSGLYVIRGMQNV
jgi:hypothetical protein